MGFVVPGNDVAGMDIAVQQRDVKPAEDRHRFRGVRGAAEQANCPPDQGSGVSMLAPAPVLRRSPSSAHRAPRRPSSASAFFRADRIRITFRASFRCRSGCPFMNGSDPAGACPMAVGCPAFSGQLN